MSERFRFPSKDTYLTAEIHTTYEEYFNMRISERDYVHKFVMRKLIIADFFTPKQAQIRTLKKSQVYISQITYVHWQL